MNDPNHLPGSESLGTGEKAGPWVYSNDRRVRQRDVIRYERFRVTFTQAEPHVGVRPLSRRTETQTLRAGRWDPPLPDDYRPQGSSGRQSAQSG